MDILGAVDPVGRRAPQSGEIVGIGAGIGFDRMPIDPAHAAQHHHRLRRLARVHRHAGLLGDVGIAAGVDHHVGQDRLSAGLVLDDDAGHGSAVHHHVDHLRVEQQADPGLDQHVEHGELHQFGIVGEVEIFGPVIGRRAVHRDEPAMQLLQDAAEILAAEEFRDERHRARPADHRVALDQHHLGAVARGADRGRIAARATADD